MVMTEVSFPNWLGTLLAECLGLSPDSCNSVASLIMSECPRSFGCCCCCCCDVVGMAESEKRRKLGLLTYVRGGVNCC